MQILRVDVNDDDALRRWHETSVAAVAAGRTDPPLPTFADEAVAFRSDPSRLREAYLAMDGGSILGAGMLELPLYDNLRMAELYPEVPPQHGRRGVGTALHVHLVERARGHGRTLLYSSLDQPLDAVPVPAVGFLTRLGYEKRHEEILRRLRHPIPPEVLDRLAAHAAERAGAYSLRGWMGACPDDLAEQYAALKARLLIDAPLGELDYEPEHWDVDRLREFERIGQDQGRTTYTTVASAADGTLVGHTQVGISSDPGRAYQYDTLVLHAHRGHRLGLALKVANHRMLGAAHPEERLVDTWNAATNGPMVAVNEALGYRPVERAEEWQREL